MSKKMTFEDAQSLRKSAQVVADDIADPYDNLLNFVRKELASNFKPDEISNAGPKVTEAASTITREKYRQYNQDALTNNKPQIMLPEEICIERVLSDLLGLGAIDKLLDDETVEDIAINGPNEVCVYRGGVWEVEKSVTFPSSTRLLEILNRGMAHSGRKANMVTPIADAVLQNKERISVVTYPISTPHPTAVIRIPRAKNITIKDMITPYDLKDEDHKSAFTNEYEELLEGEATGLLSPTAAAYLHAAVLAGLNIVAIGPTGSGKTTLLMALGRLIPKSERILIIEDTPEIDLYPGDDHPNNVLYLRTRPATAEGLHAIEQEHLVKLALRQRPDALTLGEARGPEVFDLLNALNTGHKNGLTSLHAYGVDELFGRVFLMLSQSERGRHLDAYRAANLVASTLHIAVAIEIVGKTRYVRTIAELTGDIEQKGNTYEPKMQVVFSRSGGRTKLEGLLRDSVHGKLFQVAGIPKEIYSAP